MTCLSISPRSQSRRGPDDEEHLRELLSDCVKAELQLFQSSVEHIMREELQTFMKLGLQGKGPERVPSNGESAPPGLSRTNTKTVSNHEFRIPEDRPLYDDVRKIPKSAVPILANHTNMPIARELQKGRSGDEVGSQTSDHQPRASDIGSEIGSRGYAHSNRPSQRSEIGSSHGRPSFTMEQSTLVNRRQSYFRAPSGGTISNHSKKSATTKPQTQQYTRIVEEDDDQTLPSMGGGSSRALVVVGDRTNSSIEVGRRTGSSLEQRLKSMEESPGFDVGVGFVIILNAISIGLETEYMATRWTDDTPIAFEVVNGIFCAVFSLEIALRLFVNGRNYFNPESDDFSWKVFDFVVVITQLAESIYSLDTGKSVRAMRVIRLLRTFRIIRTARLLRLFRELRVLIVSITGAMRPFVWIILLILGITYTFAVFITQLVTDYKVRYRSEVVGEERVLEELYGSLGRSMLILYQMATKGLPWGKGSEPLRVHIAHWLAVVFAAYMTFLLCGLMNVVTGAFIRTAAGIADEDKKNVLRRQMESMFQDVDEDQSGTITVEEFNNVLGKKQFQDYLKEIDLNPEQAGALYKLIDTDGTGDVEFAEVVDGCLRLHGPAKSIDLLPFVKEVLKEMEVIRHMVDEMNGRLHREPPANALFASTYPTPLAPVI